MSEVRQANLKISMFGPFGASFRIVVVIMDSDGCELEKISFDTAPGSACQTAANEEIVKALEPQILSALISGDDFAKLTAQQISTSGYNWSLVTPPLC